MGSYYVIVSQCSLYIVQPLYIQHTSSFVLGCAMCLSPVGTIKKMSSLFMPGLFSTGDRNLVTIQYEMQQVS